MLFGSPYLLFLSIFLTGESVLCAPCDTENLILMQLYIPRGEVKQIIQEAIASILSSVNGNGNLQNLLTNVSAATEVKTESSGELINPTGVKTRPVLDLTRQFKLGVSCADILVNQHATKSGLYLVHPTNLVEGPWKVFCDMETEGGGWTVFQTRDNVEPLENFTRTFKEYELGFGDFDREFWMGNVLLWALTNDDNKGWAPANELVVDMETFDGDARFARYTNFWIDSNKDGYRLHLHSYSGNAGDSLSQHNLNAFVTVDRDDKNSCANKYKGGWWYNSCHTSNLNGKYLRGPHGSYADGINWLDFKGHHYSLKKTVMRFRPHNFGAVTVNSPPEFQTKKSVADLIKDGVTLTKP